MSVEEQLSNAVQACNNLAAAVNGKIQQIDEKVDAATGSVPNVIKTMSERVFYVDSVNGSDGNDGLSNAKAFKNISAIANLLIPGGTYTVYLSPGEHYIDDMFLKGDVRFYSQADANQYRVSSAINAGDPISLSIFTKITLRKSANKYAMLTGSGTISFYNCLLSNDLEDGGYVAQGGNVNYVRAGMINAPSVQFSISGYESKDPNIPVCAISGYGGNTLSSVGWEIFAIKGKVNKLIGGNGSAKGLLAIANNTFYNKAMKSDGVTPSDIYVASDFMGVIGS